MGELILLLVVLWLGGKERAARAEADSKREQLTIALALLDGPGRGEWLRRVSPEIAEEVERSRLVAGTDVPGREGELPH